MQRNGRFVCWSTLVACFFFHFLFWFLFQLLVVSHSASQATTKCMLLPSTCLVVSRFDRFAAQLMQEKMQQILELQEQTAKEVGFSVCEKSFVSYHSVTKMSKRNLTPRTPKATQLNLTRKFSKDKTVLYSVKFTLFFVDSSWWTWCYETIDCWRVHSEKNYLFL